MRISTTYLLVSLLSLILFNGCQEEPKTDSEEKELTLLEQYTSKVDPVYEYTPVDTIAGEGFTTYVLRMVSQKWLTEAEVKDPLWWHWLTVVVPDSLQGNTAMLVIGGGNRNREQPTGLMNYCPNSHVYFFSCYRSTQCTQSKNRICQRHFWPT